MTDTAVEQTDPQKMDMSDLAELIDSRPDDTEPPAEVEEVEPEPTTGDDEEEAVEEDEAAEEEEAGEAEEEEAGDEEPQPTVEGLQSDLEHAVAQRKHFESVAGRNAGEAGYLRQQYKALQDYIAELKQKERRDDDIEPEPAPRPREYQHPERGLGSNQDTGIAQQAMSLGAQSFVIDNPGAMVTDESTGKQDFDPEIGRALQESGQSTEHLLLSQDANYVMQQTKLVLESAYRKVQADRTASKRAKAGTSRVDQAEKLKRKKRASAAASGGGVSASTPMKHVTAAEMSTEDLAKEIERRNR